MAGSRATLNLWSPDPAAIDQIRPAVPPDLSIQLRSSWSLFERARASADCSIHVLGARDHLRTQVALVDLLRATKIEGRAWPTVVLEQAVGDARHVADQDVCFTSVPAAQSRRFLWNCTKGEGARAALEFFAQLVLSGDATRLCIQLRTFLRWLPEAEIPLRTVWDACPHLGCGEGVLREHRRRELGPAAPTLREAVEIILVLRARAGWARGASVAAAARGIGITDKRLRRLCVRATAMELRDLEYGGWFPAIRHFRERWETILTGGK